MKHPPIEKTPVSLPVAGVLPGRSIVTDPGAGCSRFVVPFCVAGSGVQLRFPPAREKSEPIGEPITCCKVL